MTLAGKVALITGGSSGIGRATAVLFGQEEARVTITGRSEARGREVVREIERLGGEALFLRCDVRVAEDCRLAVNETLRVFGRLDILFNNAGVSSNKTVLDCSEEEWDLVLDTNLKGTYLMAKFALPAMIRQGSGVIINNASNWGLIGSRGAAPYCASKGGVVLLTRALAVDHGWQGIRVNCICAGAVDTPMLRADAGQIGEPAERLLARWAQVPLERVGTPEEIAQAALFLASDQSSFVSGASLVVDGGATAG